MARVNFGDSVVDELERIAIKNNWFKKAQYSRTELEKYWNNLTEEQKNEIIPGWEKMLFGDLMNQITFKIAPIITQYRKNISPKEVKETKKSNEIIYKLQQALQKVTGMPVSNEPGGKPNGIWDSFTSAAWNKYSDIINPTLPGPFQVWPLDPGETPKSSDIEWVIERIQSEYKIPKKVKTQKSNEIIYKLQQALHKVTGMPMSNKPGGIPDGVWGPLTRAAWNKYADVVNPTPAGPYIMEPLEPGEKPNFSDIKWVIRRIQSIPAKIESKESVSENIETPSKKSIFPKSVKPFTSQQESIIKSIMQLRKVDFNTALDYAKSRYPSIFAQTALGKNFDILKFNNINDELISLISNLEKIGEKQAANNVNKQLYIYKQAISELYNVTGETGKDLIDNAHPGGGTTLVPASNEGGKVETIIEEHDKIINNVMKQPTGKVAQIILKLIKTANQLENSGDIKTAKLIDKTIEEIRRASIPFVRRSLVHETAGSDNKVSVKIAKNILDIYLPYWDKAIVKYNDLYNDIFGFATGSVRQWLGGGIPSEVQKLRSAFDTALVQINNTAQDWKKGLITDTNELAKNIYHIIRVLNIGDDNITAGMRDVFFTDDAQDAGVKKYKQMLLDWWKLLNVIKSGIKKKVEKTEPQSGEEILKIKYLKLLDFLKNLIMQDIMRVSKVIGDEERKKLEEWIKDRRYNIIKGISKSTYQDVVGLQKWIEDLQNLMKKSSIKINIIRKAQPPGIPPIALPRTKDISAPKKRKIIRKGDPEVKALQQALIRAGFLSSGEDDGWWGPKTATAYNNMVLHGPIGIDKYLSIIENPLKQNHAIRPKGYITIAIRIANYIASKKQIDNTITLAGGLKISLSEIISGPNVFMESLRGKLRAKNITPEVALQYVDEIYSYLDENELDIETKKPGLVGQWRSALGKLAEQLHTKQYPLKEKSVTPEGKVSNIIKVYLPGSMLGSYKGQGINNEADLAKAFGSLPLRQWLRSPQIFKNISRKMNMSPQEYVKQVNDILSDIQLSLLKFRGKVDFISIGGKNVSFEDVVNFITMYQGDVNLLANTLNADLNKK